MSQVNLEGFIRQYLYAKRNFEAGHLTSSEFKKQRQTLMEMHNVSLDEFKAGERNCWQSKQNF